MSNGVPCMWMRGGTSRGGVFLAADLPADTAARDAFLLGVMGSPDPRQIDGLGGGDPLTSKVAIVSPSKRDDADVDYLFLQVFVDQALVTDAQGCGNMLAAVGPFAIERGLVPPSDGETRIRIYMENTQTLAVARVATPGGQVTYRGDARIDGVPGTAAAVPLEFLDVAGSTCGALLPTGRAFDTIDGVIVTCIDNGMPVVVLAASDMGVAGYETREELDANTALKARLEAIRLIAGPMMNLGDVTEKSVPKMTMVAPPRDGGAIATRTFIPHRCHASIGVFGAVSVATACILPGTPAAAIANVPEGFDKVLQIEHPSGATPAILSVDAEGAVTGAGMLRTARKIFDGEVFAQ
ncbi:4-oxalomesaconate tautomerase [Nitratireductor aquibiodomus]|uniref:4-oxalomesaconate tautomerase n=1 Tax=Nitratireductor aquibiodomus TaxID=204799 RepID=A0A1H4L3E2_9HYPH|nr:4-oxalomesaconate tautomerase [Nitratireductor aquibiodomus]SEB65006.1 4-oxalomesaconate tautomerase [Nitratireductor aquibiodomus]